VELTAAMAADAELSAKIVTAPTVKFILGHSVVMKKKNTLKC